MQVTELGYDPDAPPGRHLRAIGDVEIRYGSYGPSAIGDWPLDYEPGRLHRLVRIADREVRCSVWPGRVKQLGDWPVRYVPILVLLHQIGPFAVEHRGPWLRTSRVGPAYLRHEVGKTRPTAVLLEPPAGELTAELTGDLLLAVAFALLEHLWRPVRDGGG